MHKKNSWKKSALKHLKDDSKTWKKLSKLATKEHKSDMALIKKYRK